MPKVIFPSDAAEQIVERLEAGVDPIWRAAARALARYLERNGKLHRPIRSLEMHELEGICVAAVSGHQDARIAQAKAEDDTAKIRDLFA